jgi:hypothetical protein
MSSVIKIVLLVVFSTIILYSCGPRPYYKTAEGKRKQKHYNSIQYNQKEYFDKKNERKRRRHY